MSVPVADQDRALAFYTEVLGYELRADVERWPDPLGGSGAPGSEVGIALLPLT